MTPLDRGGGGADHDLAHDRTLPRLTWRQAFDSASQCETVRRFVVPANEENLDRLEAEVARTSP